MKLFKQLLVAPAALGLLAPIAATAAELNINDVSSYSSSSRSSKKAAKKRVKSISAFTDVYPTDWAHQALSNMLQRHGCPPVSASGSLTRYEAAALLNKCIGNIGKANAEERRLINEFSQELAVINGRIDGIEAGIAYEDGEFSTTTKLAGEAIFVVGAIDQRSTTNEAIVMNHHTSFGMETSFTGDDLMVTSIEAGNFVSSDPFGGDGVAALESTYSSSNELEVAKLFYQRPVGEKYTVTVGSIVRQDDMLAVWPSDYPTDSILDSMTYAGANSAYNLAEGAGAGIQWVDEYNGGDLSISLTYVGEASGDDSSGQAANSGRARDGILTKQGDDNVTAQVAWSNSKWTFATAITSADGGNPGINDVDKPDADDYTAFGLSAVYQLNPDETVSFLGQSYGLPTSISAGFGMKFPDHKSNDSSGDGSITRSNLVTDETTWTVGLLWEDSFQEGNTLGLGVGSAEGWKDASGYENPLAVELFYSMAVSDNITITPAIFKIGVDQGDEIGGGLVKTTFTF